MTKLNVTISIPVDINLDDLDGVTLESIEKHLNYVVGNGHRYPVERMTDGFARCIQLAIKESIESVHQTRYSREYLEYISDDGKFIGNPKWCVTSLKYINKVKLVVTGFFTSKVEEV